MNKILTLLLVGQLLFGTVVTAKGNQKQKVESPKKLITNIYEVDLYEPTGMSVDDFNHILKETSLEGQGEAFSNLEKEFKVNAVFAIAIAALESGIERRAMDNKNNYFGLTYNGQKMRFESIKDNVMAFGKVMRKPVFVGKDFATFSKIYCPPKHQFWRDVVSQKYAKFLAKLDTKKQKNDYFYELEMTLKLESSTLV